MPHSSGGGSSGGGHHAGSSSTRPAHTVTRHPRVGLTPYVYYTFGTPHFLYADTDIASEKYRRETRKGFFLGFLFALVFAFIAVICCAPASKLTPAPESECRIIDNLDVIDNEAVLLTNLNKFANRTGMYTVILTVPADEIPSGYDLEEYAYQTYLSLFPDNEKMWLLVYTEGFRGMGYAFEGMQGDETDGVLPESLANRFNKALSNSLDGGAPVGDAFFADSEKLFSVNPLAWHFEPLPVLACGGAALIIAIVCAVPYINAVLALKGGASPVKAKPDGEIKKMERTLCENCRKRYVSRLHKQCPFCSYVPRTRREFPDFAWDGTGDPPDGDGSSLLP